MNILFLGTGTSTGVPSMCCECAVCRSEDPKNKRLRASVLFQHDGYNLLIDTSTDLRQQSLTHGLKHIDSVLFTHHHADHVHGIDELRSFNYFNKTAIPCYGNAETLEELRNKFSYIFKGSAAQVGGGLPQLNLHALDGAPLPLGGMEVTRLDITHGKLTISGYKVDNCAYITDCSAIPEQTMAKLHGLDVLILNALGFDPHPTHMCLREALDVIEQLRPRQTFLTHINHKFDHNTVSADLPENVQLAYDGLTVEV